MLKRCTFASALAVAIVVISTWPWLLHLDDRTLGGLLDPDLQAGLFWPSHAARAIAGGVSPWWAPGLAWPDGQDVRLLLWNVGVQVLLLPLYLWTEPLVGLNLATLALPVLNGLAGGWLGRQVTGSTWGMAAGVVVGAAGPFAVSEAGLGRPEQALWAPAAVAVHGVLHLQAAPGDRWAIVRTAAAAAIGGAVYWFLPVFLAVCVAPDVALGVVRRRTGLRGLGALALAAGLALVFVSPFLLPILDGATSESAAVSVLWPEGTSPFLENASLSLAGIAAPPWRPSTVGTHVRLSWVVSALIMWGAWRGGMARRLALVGAVALVLALGPVLLLAPDEPLRVGGGVLHLPHRLLQAIPGFDRFWWPARWQEIALAVVPGIAAVAIAGLRRPLPWLAGLSLVVVGDTALMLRNGRIGAALGHPVSVPGVFADLAGRPGAAPIAQLPFGQAVNGGAGWTALHRQPIDSGLAWHMASVRTPAWKARLDSVPLLAALGSAVDGDPAAGGAHRGGAPWSVEEAGGFHYVALWCSPTGEPVSDRTAASRLQGANPTGDGVCPRTVPRVSGLLGWPIYRDDVVVLWVVPGVGPTGSGRLRPAPSIGSVPARAHD